MEYKCYYCTHIMRLVNQMVWWCDLQLTPNDNCKEFKQNKYMFKYTQDTKV